MNSKHVILCLLVLYFSLAMPGLCTAEDSKSALTVKEITFTRDERGGETITIFCNRSCAAKLSALEGDNPRVVLDMKDVSLLQTKSRTINTEGKLIKVVRSYLNKQTKILRVVLDMEPSNRYIVRPGQEAAENMHALIIEVTLSPERRNKEKEGVEIFPPSQEKRITILYPNLRRAEQGGKFQKAASIKGKRKPVKDATYTQLMDRGRSQLNAGEFTAAVDTFTKILMGYPQDSLGYHFRGNAYDNLDDRRNALKDWTQAANLGDTALQSYLDFLEVRWRADAAPHNVRSDLAGEVRVIAGTEGNGDL